jgi:uncharacterized membrane protein
MPVIKRSVTIERPISQVFPYVADFSKHPEWQPDIIQLHLSHDKARVGNMITINRQLRALFARLDLNADIVDYQINKKIEYRGTMGMYPVLGSYTFEPQGRSTTVTETVDIRMWFLPRWFTGWLFSLRLGARTESVLKNLKQVLESR